MGAGPPNIPLLYNPKAALYPRVYLIRGPWLCGTLPMEHLLGGQAMSKWRISRFPLISWLVTLLVCTLKDHSEALKKLSDLT